MTENQFDRFEGMLTQLVTMVGHLREDVETIKEDVAILKSDVAQLKTDLANVKVDLVNVKETQEKQHIEVIGKLELLKADQEITWTKTVENEREIARLKRFILNN